MKSNLILVLVFALFLGFLSQAYTKRTHQKKLSFKQKIQTSSQDPKSGANAQLISLSKIISQIQQKSDQLASSSGVNVQLFLEQQINPDSSKQPEDVRLHDECNLKQGYLTQIIKQENITGKTIAQGRHVFAVLNKKTISIFEAVHVDSLIASLDLTEIEAPVITLEKINCFQVNSKNSKTSGIQLCATNKTEMANWMNDIKNMLTCKKTPHYEESFEDQYDPNNPISIKISQKKREIAKKTEEKAKDKVKEQISNEEYQKLILEKQQQQRKMIEDQMKKALEELKKKRAFEEKQRRIEEQERKRQEALNQKAQEDLKCMEKKLEGEELNQRKQVQLKIMEETNQVIEENLNKTVSKISLAEQKGLDLLMNDQVELTQEKKEEQSAIQDILVQKVMDYEKVLDPISCYDEENQDGKNIKNLCPTYIENGKPVDTLMLQNCLKKDKFCNICCNYNIGQTKQLEIKTCKEKCERRIDPKEYFRKRIKTGALNETDVVELSGLGYIVTLNKGQNIPGWDKK